MQIPNFSDKNICVVGKISFCSFCTFLALCKDSLEKANNFEKLAPLVNDQLYLI